MSIAVGIPFFASRHIEPLILCVESIKKYSNLDINFFLLLNCSDPSQYKDFCFPDVLKHVGEIHIKHYCGDDNMYKQVLIDWITDCKLPYEYMFIFHSDVFLYRYGVLEKMLDALKRTDSMISCWDVPAQLYKSTFHISEEERQEFLVGPRVSSWLMCIEVGKYREFRNGCNLGKQLFLGYKIDNQEFSNQDEFHEICEWFCEQTPNCLRHYLQKKQAIIDHGGILRYYISKGTVCAAFLGKDINPSLSSMDMFYNPYGYVHIGQTDPNRYNDKLYSAKLLEVRMNKVVDLLKNEYNYCNPGS